jgi:hypothetical protein
MRRRKKNRPNPRLLSLLPLLLAAGGAAAVLLRRVRGDSSAGPAPARETAGAPPSQTPAAEVVEHTYTCECGQEYRVSGQDRHRVYWVKDAEVSDPVLGQQCVDCERALPHDHSAV